MKRALTLMTVAGATAAMLLTAAPAGAAASTPAHVRSRHAAPPAGDPVVAWNRILLDVLRTPGAQPATVHPTRSLAIVHAAIYDAAVAIDRRWTPYLGNQRAPRRASLTAAVDAAAHSSLVALYPALRPQLDDDYAHALALLPAGVRRSQGIRVGKRAAARIVAQRAGDASGATPPPFVPGSKPGDYRPTPPAFAAPVFTHWAAVTPFALARADQFRPPPPPALASRDYGDALNEAQHLGVAQGFTRTPDQTQIAQFWAGPIWTTWNEIADTAALARPRPVAATARTFALLNLSLADGAIAMYDAKYTYHVWRPVTAIQQAGADGNPATTPEPAWTSFQTTPPDPSYPGAHSVQSSAAASVLTAAYGNHLAFTASSDVLPGVARRFDGFTAAAREAGLSRIYAGVHTRLDDRAGQRLGARVATYLQHHFLLARDDMR
jgi:membrane-associated phospholipid phosphatase